MAATLALAIESIASGTRKRTMDVDVGLWIARIHNATPPNRAIPRRFATNSFRPLQTPKPFEGIDSTTRVYVSRLPQRHWRSKASPVAPENGPLTSTRWNHFQKYGYDLSRRMGTLLRSKFNFTRLEGARSAYWEAFGTEDVCKFVDAASLKSLAALRHVFVHRNGVVDHEFLQQTSNESLRAIKAGSRIRVTGQLINEIVAPAIATCVDLILAIDRWIESNPQSDG